MTTVSAGDAGGAAIGTVLVVTDDRARQVALSMAILRGGYAVLAVPSRASDLLSTNGRVRLQAIVMDLCARADGAALLARWAGAFAPAVPPLVVLADEGRAVVDGAAAVLPGVVADDVLLAAVAASARTAQRLAPVPRSAPTSDL